MIKKIGDWNIQYNPKPIPDRRFDYDFWHDDYDGADGNDVRYGNAKSEADAMEKILEIQDDIVLGLAKEIFGGKFDIGGVKEIGK